MLILLTSEENKRAEKEQLIHFFENRLFLLHVRKPGMTEEELTRWLSQFEERYLQKMVLHQYHHLAEDFPVKGIHLKEGFRSNLENSDHYIEAFQSGGLTVSSSFHDPEKLQSEASAFDYVFLSPVFTSISKSSYEGQAFNVETMPVKVIALGGMEADKIPKAKELGYAGIGILGAVWLNENNDKAFTEIYEQYQNVYQ